jgi:hypothetical protein
MKSTPILLLWRNTVLRQTAKPSCFFSYQSLVFSEPLSLLQSPHYSSTPRAPHT